jgi:alkanesulfonate monooxygenase SsuD/methylene tetrahydromethanopterin reductase-like flavin-dependent oxidoreductase (luciferase family)
VRKNMLQLAGEVAGGIVCNLINTPEVFSDFVCPNLGAGMEKAGRNSADVEICATRIWGVTRTFARPGNSRSTRSRSTRRSRTSMSC